MPPSDYVIFLSVMMVTMSDWTAIICCIYWLRDNRLHIAPQSIMTAVIYDVCDVIGKEELTSMFKINKKW